ncbi:MAG: hypothetical protein LBD49_04135 [Oscillospiraceae bacterium]|nr:hypothetical protein [Oscillospiraceae bacterium]
MKKIIGFLTAALMAVSLFGCGWRETKKTQTRTTPNSTTKTTTSSVTARRADPDPLPRMTPVPVPASPPVTTVPSAVPAPAGR